MLNMTNATLTAAWSNLSSAPPLASSGESAFWAAFVIAGLASAQFGSALYYSSHSQASKVRCGLADALAAVSPPNPSPTHPSAYPSACPPARPAARSLVTRSPSTPHPAPPGFPPQLYYFCASASCCVQSAFSLFYATGFMASQPYGPAFDFTGWQSVLYACKTPFLLVQIGSLAGMSATEIGAMLFWDMVMVGTGYGAQAAATSEGIWVLFGFGCA